MLFTRRGRNLVLNDTGRFVFRYANDIFTLGAELEETMRNLPANLPQVFNVGIADVVPKSIAHRLLKPALHLAEPVHIVCQEGKLSGLLADLAVHRLDLVIADSPLLKTMNIKAFNHKLGESGITFFATRKLAKIYSGEVPIRLNGAPMLLPSKLTSVRTKLMLWFEEHQINPRIVGEFDDSALMKTFGQSGVGIFVAPSVIEKEVIQLYGVEVLGRAEDVIEQYYAISVERKLSHPAVVAITKTARSELFIK